jgi:hypothetical protein
MDDWLPPQLRAAILRALYGALLSFAIATLVALQQGQPIRVAVLTGASVAVAYLAARGGVEGLYDSQRAKIGLVKDSDVSALPRG